MVRSEAMGGDYPSKPMALYTTIWDASTWATAGGRYKVNYKYSPFVAEFKDLVLEGCPVDPIQELPYSDCEESDLRLESKNYGVLTPTQRSAMRKFRESYMYYSYCYDTLRYPVTPPECVIVQSEQARFNHIGRLKFGGSHGRHKRRSKRKSRAPIVTNARDQNM